METKLTTLVALVVFVMVISRAERTQKNMDRVLDIVNTELCFGDAPKECKCYTQNMVKGPFKSLKEYGECFPESCRCEKYGLVSILAFRSMNEFLCGFEVPSMFFCFDGGNMTRPYKTVKDFEDCVAVAFRCPESPATIGMAVAFKGFYPEEEKVENEEEEENENDL